MLNEFDGHINLCIIKKSYKSQGARQKKSQLFLLIFLELIPRIAIQIGHVDFRVRVTLCFNKLRIQRFEFVCLCIRRLG